METPAVGGTTLGLRDYLRILRRRKLTVIITVLVFIAASILYDVSKTKEYTATAQLQLTPQISTALLEADNSTLLNGANPVDVPTDSQIIESQSIANRVKAKVPGAPPATVSQVNTTDVVDVSVTSISPQVAARAANAYATVYIQAQQLASMSALSSATNDVQSHINSIQDQINSLNSQLAGVSPSSTTAEAISTELASLYQSQATLRQQISTYQTAQSLTTGGGQVVSRATVPTKPSAPKPVTYGILALIVGLVIGVAIALLQERLDENLHSVEDLERIVGDLPIIGLVPPVPDWKDRTRPYLVSLLAPKSPPSEAYRSLRTSIQFLGLDRDLNKVLLTSPRSTEGKTTTVANLAVTMAQSGQRVVIVDCDLRRPRVHTFFGLSNYIGFTSVLVGEHGLEDTLFEVEQVPNLTVVPSGIIPPNPSELLSGHRAQEVISEIAARSDVVLFDSPPVLPVTDAVVLAPHMDTVVLVASAGTSKRRDVGRALTTLQRVDAPVGGIVLNRAMESDAYADYQYSYAYGGDAEVNEISSGNGNGRKAAHAGAGGRRSRGG